MDDLTTLERRLTEDASRVAGPSRPVDAAAVLAAVTAADAPRGSFGTMFSATKLVVAGAIVALFGGLLLAVFLTRPATEPIPAATTGTPAPTTTEALLSSMTTEEVEPGVFRVIDDGHRELAADAEIVGHGDPRGGADIVAGLDGSVWWFESGRFDRLGDERTIDAPWPEPEWVLGPRYLEVAPDGTIWSLRLEVDAPEPGTLLTSFDGRTWTVHDGALPDGLPPNPKGRMEVRSDGSVWIVQLGGGQTLARLAADGWERVPGSVRRIPGGLELRLFHLAVADATDDGQRTYRVDASPWEDPIRRIWDGESGPNGELWGIYEAAEGVMRLALFDGDAWRTFETGPDVGSTGPYETGPRVMEVAPDGSVWLKHGGWDWTGSGCDGIANFDGESVGRHLRDLCIFTADVAPDGHVWVVAGPTPTQLHAYVITPEAIMGARS